MKTYKNLPIHLKKLATNINEGKTLSGKPMTNKQLKNTASILGAGFYKDNKGRLIQKKR